MTRASPSTVTPFHPDLRRRAAVLPRGSVGPRLLPVVRALESLMARRALPPSIELARVGTITVRLHRPPDNDRSRAALLWIHGGGYVLGTPAQDDRLCQRIANELGILVAAVAYRRAPEHPFPTPLHDCYDALSWLTKRADVDSNRVAIGGASAGAGLAAALAILARDRGEIRPVVQVLSYPMLDDRTAMRRDIDQHQLRLWNNKANRFGWRAYLGHEPGGREVSALAAPARHDDLSGLPPTWIGIGTHDLFYDEDFVYAQRLDQAGVPCQLHVVAGAFHGFDAVAPRAGITAAFRSAQLEALRVHLQDQKI